MKHIYFWTTAVIGLAIVIFTPNSFGQTMRLFDLDRQQYLSSTESIKRLMAARIVFVGEHHNHADHHKAQLMVIESLHNANGKVAIGLEMFRRDSQKSLDQWIAGQISEAQFKPIYLDNWNFPWKLYRPIFSYAKKNRIPMAGLNVSRQITTQVAHKGFASLNASQKGELEGITCNVTNQYREFINKAYGAHAHGSMKFDRFCEAQLVWDTAMAVHALGYLKKHPDSVLVILAGSGHARKLGIPSQIAKRDPLPYAVILPETEGIFDKTSISVQDADFLLINK